MTAIARSTVTWQAMKSARRACGSVKLSWHTSDGGRPILALCSHTFATRLSHTHRPTPNYPSRVDNHLLWHRRHVPASQAPQDLTPRTCKARAICGLFQSSVDEKVSTPHAQAASDADVNEVEVRTKTRKRGLGLLHASWSIWRNDERLRS